MMSEDWGVMSQEEGGSGGTEGQMREKQGTETGKRDGEREKGGTREGRGINRRRKEEGQRIPPDNWDPCLEVPNPAVSSFILQDTRLYNFYSNIGLGRGREGRGGVGRRWEKWREAGIWVGWGISVFTAVQFGIINKSFYFIPKYNHPEIVMGI